MGSARLSENVTKANSLTYTWTQYNLIEMVVSALSGSRLCIVNRSNYPLILQLLCASFSAQKVRLGISLSQKFFKCESFLLFQRSTIIFLLNNETLLILIDYKKLGTNTSNFSFMD